MNRYLSFGGGVNSTALMLYLLDQDVEFESVFADHGGDHPETYEYLEYLAERGYRITRLQTREEGWDLYEYCLHRRMLPNIFNRWCTDKFKVTPLHRYFQKPAIVYLGIDYGEQQRAHDSRNPDLDNQFPLIEAGLYRQDCIKLIEAHGLRVPRKSGCWFCPFSTKSRLKALLREYPCLFEKIRELEQAHNKKALEEGRPAYYLMRMPIDAFVNSNQLDLFGEIRPCLCELEKQ
ncbi:MAG: hypothetical protein DDT19_00060 [Syntrophomonadaceae bacterium]|nr:hypothetical protein [Bacillota bacterium]